MDQWAANGVPFVFIIDFEMERPMAVPLRAAADEGIFYSTPLASNAPSPAPLALPVFFEKFPVPFEDYLPGFEIVQAALRRGDTFLVNYTAPTPIATNLTLRQIFDASQARYRVCFRNEFTCFSPESFVSIRGNRIETRPMKGTIDADIPHARRRILEDFKEKAEHCTVVDLLRNDLNRISKRVRVERFRYVERIETNQRPLLQVSSLISGELPAGWRRELASMLRLLLPAGSVSGAPKGSTLEVIRRAEGRTRGYYTGIFGICTPDALDSCVLIRFIERSATGLHFRSGGGITCFSEAASEYREMIDKVYLPLVGATVRPPCKP